jgi:hypothetical protein
MKELQELVGKKVKAIGMTEDHLRFSTDKGDFTFGVEGDCCSHSYFYDFVGIQKLLNNGPIKAVEEIPMEDDGRRMLENDSVSCYGFRFITEDPLFGDVSSVMSFRNDSNGYYGGELVKSKFTEYIPMISNSEWGEKKDHIYV